ncbi:MAG: Suppressor of Sensor Kinase (SLN1), partial [Paramarteilia canceri]
KDEKKCSVILLDFLKKCFLRDPSQRHTCKQLKEHPFLAKYPNIPEYHTRLVEMLENE